MRHLLSIVALAMIGALGFYTARTLSPDAISLLFGMCIMTLAIVPVCLAVIVARPTERPTGAPRRRTQLERPTYYITQDAPAQPHQLTQAKRIEVIK